MKQFNLFSNEVSDSNDKKYTNKISTPIYTPKNKKPSIYELLDSSKTRRLIKKIEMSNINEEEKKFLIEASKRHNVFNYSKIADYYSHSSKEMQNLMEENALIIIDFEKAIQLGFVKLQDELFNQYINEPTNEK